MKKLTPRISSANPHPLEVLIHVVSWLLIFGFPLLFIERGDASAADWTDYLRHLCTPVAFGIVFYANYGVLVPRLLFRKDKRPYFFYNTLLVLAVGLVLHFSSEWLREREPNPLPDNFIPPQAQSLQPRVQSRPVPPPHWVFFGRDLIMICGTVGLAAAIRMSREWGRTEAARREAERARTEAELKNLRSQMNPHFLLNTLNNIYALIAFDSDKAQQAVMDLSKLLRHLLYDNSSTYVPLQQEVAFIRNYIDLMRIRLTREVEVAVDIHICPDTETQIAPSIFISLIENAFKHGISPTAPSFIRLELTEEEHGTVRCVLTNSNFPKNRSDKSDSGIGLEQVRRRLELLYPGRYRWQCGLDKEGRIYTSDLTIFTKGIKPSDKI